MNYITCKETRQIIEAAGIKLRTEPTQVPITVTKDGIVLVGRAMVFSDNGSTQPGAEPVGFIRGWDEVKTVSVVVEIKKLPSGFE